MLTKYLLGIDNGGTMTKATLFTDAGAEVATVARETPVISPKEGYFERDMLVLWEITAGCVRDVLDKAGVDPRDVLAVGCTGHGKGLYLWGKDGKPSYNAIASTDYRARDVIAEWEQDGTIRQAMAMALQPIIECQPVALLAWLKRNRPAVMDTIQWVFEAKDYIRFMLTDTAKAEVTDYSGTGLMNLTTGRFDPELLALFGLSELEGCLPELCLSYEIAGYVTEKAAEQTGLLPGTPVCGGMFDIDACAVAMDVTDPARLCTITGTWSINEYPAAAPVRYDTSTHNSLFCLPGMYLIEESSPTSAGNLDWFIRQFLTYEKQQAKEQGVRFYDYLDERVDELPPQDSHVIYFPFLYGYNAEKSLSAGFQNISGSHTKWHLARALYEGVAFNHRYHIEKLMRFRDRPAAVRMAGGAVKSPVWRQMFADVLNCPIEIVDTAELGAKGAVMAAAVAIGLCRDYPDAARRMVRVSETVMPNAAKTPIYEEKYREYRALLNQLTKE